MPICKKYMQISEAIGSHLSHGIVSRRLKICLHGRKCQGTGSRGAVSDIGLEPIADGLRLR